MEFTQVVENRYSCKNFSGRKVEAEKLQVILEAGRVAPTAKNLQEQRVYVVQSEEGLKKIDAVTPCRYGAPTCLVVAFDKNHVFTYPGEKRDSGVEDVSIVATHMMLAAANAGVDSCWLNFFDPDELAKELGLPENEEVLMILDLGYAAEGAGPQLRRVAGAGQRPLQCRVEGEDSVSEILAVRARPAFAQHIAGTVQQQAAIVFIVVGAPLCHQLADRRLFLPGQFTAHFSLPSWA
jgi:nitroreductase